MKTDIWSTIRMIIRMGTGLVLMIIGSFFLIYGSAQELKWPDYVISGSIISVIGLLAFIIDSIKEIKKQELDIKYVKAIQAETVKLQKEHEVEVAKNWDAYKSGIEKAQIRKEKKNVLK